MISFYAVPIVMQPEKPLSAMQQISSVSPRQVFLEIIGLEHDPFVTPVAEQELRGAGAQPNLYSYFCPPPLIPRVKGQTTFQTLRMKCQSFVYGEPGDGKTTLRLALEANCRTVLDHTLVVTYDLGEDIERPLTWDEHANQLAKALAIDLFIQIVEQYNPLEYSPTPEQITALRQQFKLGGRPLQRLARQILDQPSPAAPSGLSTYWPIIGKSSVRYVPASDQLLDLIRQCLAPGQVPMLPGPDLLQAGLLTARLWNFSQTIVLVDNVDARQRATQNMFALIETLLINLPRLEAANVYFKFFLPLELQALVAARLPALDLPAGYFEAKMEWTDDSLRELLAQRFHAAGSYYVGFDALAGEELQDQLDALIIRAAIGSPRRMLRVISILIDEHVASSQVTPKFSTQDWDNTSIRARQAWGYTLPRLALIRP
jgi:hypothetical protein